MHYRQSRVLTTENDCRRDCIAGVHVNKKRNNNLISIFLKMITCEDHGRYQHQDDDSEKPLAGIGLALDAF